MPKYRRMTDPGYTSPFISRMPGIPASMEDDREPEYEYKDNLDEDDDIWEWEKCEDEDNDIWVEYGDGWHSEKPPQSDEYDPDDPLGLSYGRVTCTMATLIDPWEEATAEVLTQDGNGNWIVDEESKDSRGMLIRSCRQWL